MTYLAISIRVTLVVTSFCLLLHATLSEAAKKTLLTYVSIRKKYNATTTTTNTYMYVCMYAQATATALYARI